MFLIELKFSCWVKFSLIGIEFEFEFNSIHFFHQLISWLLVVVCNNVKPKFRKKGTPKIKDKIDEKINVKETTIKQS